MRRFDIALLRFRSLLRRRRVEHELDAELRFHLEQQIAANLAAGMKADEARNAALRSFGGVAQLKEECRDARRLGWLEDFFRDLRFSLRSLSRAPGFTAVAVITLALGIGANSAIFSVVEAVLLRPLPYKDADRLVDLTEYRPGGVDSGGVSYPDYLDWKQQNTVFEETAAYFLVHASNDIVVGGPFSTERARYSTVSNSFFGLLGVQPQLGRGFSADDEVPGGAKAFLVSDALWHSGFGGNPDAIGKTFLLDGENFTLRGVMPPGFDFPQGCGIWLPTGTFGESGLHDRVSHAYHVLGRLRPGTSLAQAETQIESIQARLAQAYPATDADWHVQARPLLDEIVGNTRTSLLVLLGAVGFILLIACANVVNLMLARAASREREFAIRSALGAARMRLLRQNVAESFLLVCLSSALALAFAKWGLALTVSLTSVQLPRMQSFRLNLPLLAFLAALAAVTTVLVGLAPTLQNAWRETQDALREGQFGAGSGLHAQRLRSGLVISEVALALLLLCGAGLMLRSFLAMNRVDPGFRTDHLLTMKIALPSGAYPKVDDTAAYLDRLLDRLQALPGVQAAAAASTLPLSGESDWGTFLMAGSSAPDWTKASVADWRGVSAEYFRTLGVPLLRGREFSSADVKNRNTVIVNQAMAKKFWPGGDPIGQRLFLGHQSRPMEIIGIVGDVHGAGLSHEAKPEMYTVLRGFWYAFLVLRTSGDPSAMTAAAQRQIAALDAGVPVYQVASMDQLLSRSAGTQRFNLFLLALFGGLALTLAAVGIYGNLAFSVSRRTHEIGVRLALGARAGDILRLIVRQGMMPVLAGVLLGVAGAAGLTRLIASLLYGVTATDPATLLLVAVLLAVVAALACYLPARRASRVDPMIALRHE